MKRLPSGLILLDSIDIICISFSVGSGIAYLVKRYRNYKRYKLGKGEDPLVSELKKKSPVIIFSEDGKSVKLPLLHGGDIKKLTALSLWIKSKKLALLLRVLTKKKALQFLRIFLFASNGLLTLSSGFHFVVSGSLDYTQFILISFSPTLGGFLMGLYIVNPVASILLPLAILYGRGIEDILDPYENCKAICKVAEKFHNKQLSTEMTKLNSIVESGSMNFNLRLIKYLCFASQINFHYCNVTS